MQFEFLFDRERATDPFESLHGPSRRDANKETWLRVGLQQVQLHFVRHPRARRYVLRLCSDGTARVTVPRRGSWLEGRRFANRNVRWLEKQLLRQASRPTSPKEWTIGTEIFFRGEKARLDLRLNRDSRELCFADQAMRIHLPATGNSQPVPNLRPLVETHLRKLATAELPIRVTELAQQQGFKVRRVSVRNQRSRWGSCSRRGTISLNWRLIQTPDFVRDYIILHELAHLKEMNHSKRFWREVARLCPEFEKAERWLKEHSDLFR